MVTKTQWKKWIDAIGRMANIVTVVWALVLNLAPPAWAQAPMPTAKTADDAPVDNAANLELANLQAAMKVRMALTRASLATPGTAALALLNRSDANPRIAAMMKGNEAFEARVVTTLHVLAARDGWPGVRRLGSSGAETALFLAATVHRDAAFQRWSLAQIDAADAQGDLPRNRALATAIDSLTLATTGAQRYGTSLDFDLEKGRLVAKPIADRFHVNARRKTLGLPKLGVELSIWNTFAGFRMVASTPPEDRHRLVECLKANGYFRYEAPGDTHVEAEFLAQGFTYRTPVGRDVLVDRDGIALHGVRGMLNAMRPLLEVQGVRWTQIDETVASTDDLLLLDGQPHALWTNTTGSKNLT